MRPVSNSTFTHAHQELARVSCTATHHYTIQDDGLQSDWFGSVWCNPPYGKATAVWLEKLAAYGDGIALVFARTDTKWAQSVTASADCICFVSGRIHFYEGDTTTQAGSPGSGSMLIAFGATCATALRASGLGVCMTPER